MYKRIILVNLILIIFFFSSYSFAQDNQKYKDFVKSYVMQLKTLNSYDIEYFAFDKKSPISEEEKIFFDSLLNPANFNELKKTFEALVPKESVSKDMNIKGCENFFSTGFYHLKKSDGNIFYWKILPYVNNKIALRRENFLTPDDKYIHILPVCGGDSHWEISKNENKNSEFYGANPIEHLISYSQGAYANREAFSLYLDEFVDKAEEFSISKTGNLSIINMKYRDYNITITLNEDTNEILTIQKEEKFSPQLTMIENRFFDKYKDINGIKFPQIISYKNFKNDKFLNEYIMILNNIKINDGEIKIEIGENNIKDGELVIDNRINYSYTKGHPENR